MAIPSAAEIEVEACPAPKWSKLLSSRERNFLMPPALPSESNFSLRPVRIL
jgi:hypothetical protein